MEHEGDDVAIGLAGVLGGAADGHTGPHVPVSVAGLGNFLAVLGTGGVQIKALLLDLAEDVVVGVGRIVGVVGELPVDADGVLAVDILKQLRAADGHGTAVDGAGHRSKRAGCGRFRFFRLLRFFRFFGFLRLLRTGPVDLGGRALAAHKDIVRTVDCQVQFAAVEGVGVGATALEVYLAVAPGHMDRAVKHQRAGAVLVQGQEEFDTQVAEHHHVLFCHGVAARSIHAEQRPVTGLGSGLCAALRCIRRGRTRLGEGIDHAFNLDGQHAVLQGAGVAVAALLQGEGFAVQGPFAGKLAAHHAERGLTLGFQLDPVAVRAEIEAVKHAGDAFVATEVGVFLAALSTENGDQDDDQRHNGYADARKQEHLFVDGLFLFRGLRGLRRLRRRGRAAALGRRRVGAASALRGRRVGAALRRGFIGLLNGRFVGLLNRRLVGLLDWWLIALLNGRLISLLDRGFVGLLDRRFVGLLDRGSLFRCEFLAALRTEFHTVRNLCAAVGAIFHTFSSLFSLYQV